jgi:CPA1 family monovalent cation:H+ antiporter
MSYHGIFASVVLITAIAAFLNERYLRLPKTIALTIISLMISIIVTNLLRFNSELALSIRTILSGIDFRKTVLDVMLGYLLFASSLRINVLNLRKHLYSIMYLSSLGVVVSTLVTGFLLWLVSEAVHFSLSLPDCFIFGALISPTDPVAVNSVLGLAKNVPEDTKAKITGEALFNDAAGILVLIILARIFYQSGDVHLTIGSISFMFIKEALGGIIGGMVIGHLTSQILCKTEDQEVSILLTIASAGCGYILANTIHISGPITMVVAGLVVGSHLKKQKFSKKTSEYLANFWSLVDDLLNALLFVLIGLEMLTISIHYTTIIMGIIAIFIVMLARFGSVILLQSIYILFNHKKRSYNWPEVGMLCWGGIRGAISIALTIAIIGVPSQLIAMTYFLVIFSILIQGSSLKWVVEKLYPITIESN